MVERVGGVVLAKNAEIARALKELALLVEIEGKEKYAARAYKRAVRSITSLGEDIEAVANREELESIPGIGKGISKKIRRYLETGSIPLLERLRARIPVKVMVLDSIPGVGPKTIALLYHELGVTDLDSLEKAARDGKIALLKGMGKKTETQIIEGIDLVRSGLDRTLLADAMSVVETIRQKIQNVDGVNQVVIAGSYRRRRETVGDLDFLVDADDPELVMEAFSTLDNVQDVLVKGPTKTAVRLKSSLQMDLRVIPTESFGAGLQYFTGSVDHNVRLRGIARSMGLKLNEYGLYRDEELVAGEREEDIYESLGLAWITPELRENHGEIDAVKNGTLPHLVKLDDIRGDLHSHTDQSDGSNTIEEMLDAAAEREHEYFCVSDHTQSLTIANGMDEERLLERIEEIDTLNTSGKWDMMILKGAEVDILADGTLDITDDVLAQLDVVTVSVHSRMKDSKKVMTERVCTALENKHVHLLGHPTGRLIGKRAEFEIDLEPVFEVAKKNQVAMELNANPYRLDLNPGNLRAAINMDLKIAINTDAHKVSELDYMKFGIFQARRGWITKSDVLNTMALKDLQKWLKK
ncbi:MAG: DNA polymerase/3'-5' exonuclease PolX [Candidatus Lokiarchaeota archaeon]|nr:DNA polymerase/3'-5' exonuclease PolX [Candidatus Lokiarchaeota archaeon]